MLHESIFSHYLIRNGVDLSVAIPFILYGRIDVIFIFPPKEGGLRARGDRVLRSVSHFGPSHILTCRVRSPLVAKFVLMVSVLEGIKPTQHAYILPTQPRKYKPLCKLASFNSEVILDLIVDGLWIVADSFLLPLSSFSLLILAPTGVNITVIVLS